MEQERPRSQSASRDVAEPADKPSAFARAREHLVDHEIQQCRRSDSLRRNEDHASTRSPAGYDPPDSYHNVDNTQPPVENAEENEQIRRLTIGRPDAEQQQREFSRRVSSSSRKRDSRLARRSSTPQIDYDIPNEYANLDEVTGAFPVRNPDEAPIYRHKSLEEARSQQQERRRSQANRASTGDASQRGISGQPLGEDGKTSPYKVSRLATQFYTVSYLVLFSILGTLARLGLQALTSYPGAPVIFTSIWPNFAGSLVIGFLAEDRMLFSCEWGVPTYANQIRKASQRNSNDEESGPSGSDAELAAAKKTFAATKKTIPLYIGLATGFCGSFTSFSSFMRDAFLALSNDLTTPGVGAIRPRNGGYSFMAVVAVVSLTVSMSLSGLFLGAHLAIATEPVIPAVPYRLIRKGFDRMAVVLGWGCWLGAILLSALPPDRDNGGQETWRGRATFALVFAPLGCLARFYVSLYLNGKIASFPLGTFAVNVFGTGILAMSWDLAHVPLGGVVGCQVLQGVEDGFCGCLTTVSTWVAELSSLRRRHAYIYGLSSVLVSLALMVAIMGGLRWRDGFAELCVTTS